MKGDEAPTGAATLELELLGLKEKLGNLLDDGAVLEAGTRTDDDPTTGTDEDPGGAAEDLAGAAMEEGDSTAEEAELPPVGDSPERMHPVCP
jgi:hypothetical protein